MKRIIARGALAGIAATLFFHQTLWALLWLWASGRFPAPHVFPESRVHPVDLGLLFMGGAIWGAATAIAIERFSHRKPVEIGFWVGAASTLFCPSVVETFVLRPLQGGGSWPPHILDLLLYLLVSAVFPLLAVNMAWGIGVGLVYPILARQAAANPRP